MLTEISVCLGRHQNSNAYETLRAFDGPSSRIVRAGLLDGELIWRQHDGGHEDRSNMKYFIAWPTNSSSTRHPRKPRQPPAMLSRRRFQTQSNKALAGFAWDAGSFRRPRFGMALGHGRFLPDERKTCALWFVADHVRLSSWPLANALPPIVQSLLELLWLWHSLHERCAAK